MPGVNDPSGGQLQVLREFVEQGASIDGDVLEIVKDTWMVHGVVGYDGEIPIAVFDTYDGARHVLDQVPGPGAMTTRIDPAAPIGYQPVEFLDIPPMGETIG
jgi:hypothetical protein